MNFLRFTQCFAVLLTVLGTSQLALAQTNDAGVIALVQPTNPYTSSGGLQPIEVRIKNWGSNTILSVNVYWEFNGAAQPFIVYPGLPLQPGDEANVMMGNITLPVSGSHTLKFWTNTPNGVTDGDTANDTLEVVLCQGMSGTYTVGTFSSDFPTIAAAINALHTCGVVGPVQLDLFPQVYNGQIVIGEIPGASATNTVTFNGTATNLVTLAYNGTATAYGSSTVVLDGADYVRFTDCSISNAGMASVAGVLLTNGADGNVIEDCNITMVSGSGLVDVMGIAIAGSFTDLTAEGNNGNGNLIQNNDISGGEDGIHIEGLDLANNTNNTISGNRIWGCDMSGIYADDQDGIEISGNHIWGILNGSLGDGIYAFDLMNFSIEGNNIHAPDYAIHISDGNFDGAPTQRGRIVNNMALSDGDAAVFFLNVEDTDIWHNTVMGVKGISMDNPVALNVRNNIFVGTTNVAFESLDAATMQAMNNNIFRTVSGTNIIKYGTPNYATLAAWQGSGFGYDANSFVGNPIFASSTDLHVLGALANDVGFAVGVTTDIDGQNRPMGANVDIGADEYTPYTNDALAIQLAAPTAGACGNASQAVQVVIQNLGTSAITSMNIGGVVSGAGSGTLSGTYSGNLAPNATATVNLGTINTFNGGYFTFTIYTQLSGEQNPSNDTFTVTIGITPSSPITAVNDTVCTGLPATLSAGPVSGLNLQWFTVPSGGTSIYTGTTYSIPSLTSSTTYYAEAQSLVNYNLTTTTAAGNGQNGAMFDVTAINTVTVTGFTGYATGGGTFNYQIYYKAGGAAGFTTNAAAWTLAGTVSVPVTANVLHPIPITLAVTIPAGQTYAFYVTTTGSTIAYTNGTTLGAVFAADANIQFKQGYGKAYPFGADFSPRVWNGVIHYSTGGASCNTDRIAIEAVAMPQSQVDLGADVTICSNESVVLDAQLPNGSYVWSNNATTQQITVNAAGAYDVRVTDAYGCFSRDTVNVSVYPSANLSATTTNPSCSGDTDGAVNLNVSGGVGGFGFAWSNSASTQNLSNVGGGIYAVTVTDQGTGCEYTTNATLSEPAVMSASAQGTNASCNGNNDGMVSATATGGDGNYTYLWSNNANTAAISGLSAGNYTVTVTDGNGCSATASQNISAPSSVSIALDSIHDETVDIGGGIFISANGGTAPYGFVWNTGANTEDLDGVIAATYTVVVIDANGCTDTATFTVNYAMGLTENAMNAGVQQIRLFPNPTNNVAYLQLQLAQAVEVRIDVLDMNGRLMQSLAPQSDMLQNYTLDLSAYASGVYNVRMVVGNAVISQKLVLTR